MEIMRFAAGIFLFFVGGTAATFGFSRTVLSSRKQDQKLYENGTIETARLLESGTKLATRALAWGTFYAFLGTGTFCYGVWKLSGASNVSNWIVIHSLCIKNWLIESIVYFTDAGISRENGLNLATHFERGTTKKPHRIR